MPARLTMRIRSIEALFGLGADGARRSSGRLGAWLIAALFLALGIGGGLTAWSRESEGASIEQIVSALAIAVVGILAAVVHSAAFLAARRARESRDELDQERKQARQALDEAAEIQAQPGTRGGHDLPGPDEVLGNPDSNGGTLEWQVERVARYFEADAALLEDLARSHGQTKVAKAWRKHEGKSQTTRQAMQELIELSSSSKD